MGIIYELQNISTAPKGILLLVVIFIISKILKYFFSKKRNQKKLLKKYGQDLDKLQKMDWKEFELLCEDFFKRRGWNTFCSDKSGADGGVDVWLERKKEKSIVQCKRYGKTKVGVKVVREMFGLMHSNGCDSAYIMTSSSFTKEGYLFAKGKRISLIDGKEMIRLIKEMNLRS